MCCVASAALEPRCSQQRRGYSGRISGRSQSCRRSCDLRREKGRKAAFATALYFLGAPRVVYSVIGAVGRCAAVALVVLLVGNVDLTSEAVDNTPQACVACFGFSNISRPVQQTA